MTYRPIIAGLVAIVGLLLVFGCQQKEPSEPETAIRPVRSVVVQKIGGRQDRLFSGVAVASMESALSFKVSGTLRQLYVRVGDIVKAGDPLAQLDTTDFKVAVESALASLRTAEADARAAQTSVDTNRSSYARIERLYESGSVSLSEFEQAKGNFETAKAQLQAAKSQIASAKTQHVSAKNQMSYTRIQAPFSGIINRIDLEENEEVAPGGAVLSISALDRLEVQVSLSDLYISSVRQSMPVDLTFPALPDLVFKGTVTEVSFSATDSATYPVTIAIGDPDKRLRPGMAANVTFDFGLPTGDPARIYLPPVAVGEDSDGNFVFVIETASEDQAVARRRHIKLGALTQQGFIVEEGLEEGDRVATSGIQVLLEGMPVKLMNAIDTTF